MTSPITPPNGAAAGLAMRNLSGAAANNMAMPTSLPMDMTPKASSASASGGFLGVATLPITSFWSAVGYSPTTKTWLVCGGGSNARIARSTDGGRSWSLVPAFVNSGFNAIVFGNGVWVVKGSGGGARSFDNGKNWVTFAIPSDWSDLVFANGVFMAIRQLSLGGEVVISTDGFQTSSTGTIAAGANYTTLAFGGGSWLVKPYGSPTPAQKSTDNGATWTSTSWNQGNPSKLVYGGGVFGAADQNGTLFSYSTTAGTTSSSATFQGPSGAQNTGNAGIAAAASDTKMVVVCDGLAYRLISTSTIPNLGASWSYEPSPVALGVSGFNSLAFGGGRFAQVGYNSNKIVFFT